MTDITLEQRARELLIAELEKIGATETARVMRNVTDRDNWWVPAALEAALRLSAGANAVEQLDESEKDVALGQAVEFASYVEGHAKGGMREAARKFLSLPYAQKIAARLARAPEED